MKQQQGGPNADTTLQPGCFGTPDLLQPCLLLQQIRQYPVEERKALGDIQSAIWQETFSKVFTLITSGTPLLLQLAATLHCCIHPSATTTSSITHDQLKSRP